MESRKRFFLGVSLVIIISLFYQVASLIPLRFPLLNAWLSSFSFAAEQPKAKRVELSDKRKEHSKTYLNEDGTLTTEVSQQPINYKDKDGKVKPIDTTLVEDSNGFKAEENSLAVDFNNRADNLINISTEKNSRLIYKVVGSTSQEMTPAKKDSNKLSYSYKEGATLSYEVQEGRLKEEIVLKKAPEDNTFSFELELKGLTPKEEKNGSISLLNKEDETSLVIERPYMEDANSSDIFAPPETFSSYDIEMKLTLKQGSTYTLTLTPDKGWLQSEERAYPVKIDPTFSVPNTSTADTYIRSTASGSSFGAESRVYVGGWSETDQIKTLLKFDLSFIPQGATINSATLKLAKRDTLESNINSGNYNQFSTNTRVYRATSNWYESTATYSNMGSYFNSTILDQGSEGSPSFNVTDTVNKWHTGVYSNYGFMLDNTSEVKLLDDSSPGGSPYQTPTWSWVTYPVHSGNKSHKESNKSGTHQHYYNNSPYTFFIPANSWIRTWVYPSPNYPPREIMLQYNVAGNWAHRAYWGENLINWGTNGTASRYRISTTVPGSGSWQKLMVRADYVNLNNKEIQGAAFTLFNGQAYFDEVQTWRTQNFYTREASVDESLKPKLTVTYDLFGFGREVFKTYKDYSGVSVDTQTGNLLLETADIQIGGRGPGTSISRTYNSQDSNTSIFGKGISSYPDSARVTYNGNKALFATTSGAIHSYTQQTDGTFKRPPGASEDLIKNTDGTFTLKDKEGNQSFFNSSGRLTKETDKNANSATYSYNAAGNIQTIKDANNRVTDFSYNSDGTVSKITDFTGREVSYSYTNSRLTKVTNQNGEATTYSYDSNGRLSSITNPNNASTSVTYDSQGRATNITNPLGNKMSFSYTTSGVYDDSNTKNKEASYTTVTDPKGYKYIYYMTSTGLVTKESEPMGPTADPTTAEANFPNDEEIEAEAIDDFTAFKNDAEVEQEMAEEGLPDPVIEDPLKGGTTTYSEYDSNYNLERRVEKDGKITSYTYDAKGNMLTQSTSAGKNTYIYDSNNNLLTETTATGETTNTSYDSKGNLVSTTDAEGNTTSNTYDEFGNQITVTDAKGNVTTNEYDANSNLVGTTDAEGVVTTYTYDEFGNKQSETNEGNGVTETTYDVLGRELTQKSAPTEGGSYSLTKNYYGSIGNKTKEEVYEVKADGSENLKSWVSYEFDLAGRLLSQTDNAGAKTSFTYDANGNKLTETNPLGGTTTYQYDSLNRVIKETEPDGNFTAYKYDASENIVKEGTPEGTTVNLLDKNGNEVATASPDGSINKTIYDKEGEEELTTDAQDNVTDLDYDAEGNITSVTDPLGNTTSYTYDANQNETTTIASDNSTVSTDYNQADEVTTETDQIGQQTITNYNNAGVESRIIQPNNQNRTMAYDAAGNNVQVDATGTTNNSSDIQTTYDALGNPTSTTTTDAQTNQTETKTNITYDSANRVTSFTDLLGITINFEYDEAGNLIKLSDSTGATTYTYDASSKLTKISSPPGGEGQGEGAITTYGYDTSGNLTNIALPNGVQTNTSYDAGAKVTSLTNKKGTDTISGYDYTYDLNGNITSAYDGEGSALYTYDTLNRLTRVTNKDASQTSYIYDEQGNRQSKTDSTPPSAGQAGTTYYTYDEANQLVSESKPNGNTIFYAYDDNGNLTMKNSSTEGLTTYSYDNKNQLVKVVKPNGDTVEYTYDGEGKRYSKKGTNSTGETISERFYHYDAEGNIVMETAKPGSPDSSFVIPSGSEESQVLVKYIRDASGKAISMIQGTNTYYFIYNVHGDATSLTDELGNAVAGYTYDEFGNLTNETGDIYNPIRYSGANNAYYDSETGLYKMGTRYYDSSIGRWITRDPYEGEQQVPLSKNKYIYVENNPVNKIDSTGYWADWRHRDWTKKWATQVGFKYRRSVAKGAFELDNWWNSAVFHPRWHFDGKEGSGQNNDSRYIYFMTKWRTAVRLAKKRRPMEGSRQLGYGLHAIQDQFSHGYIRTWEHGVDYRLGGIWHIIIKGRYSDKADNPNWPGDPSYKPDPKYETKKGWPGYPKRVARTETRTKYYLLKYKRQVGRYF